MQGLFPYNQNLYTFTFTIVKPAFILSSWFIFLNKKIFIFIDIYNKQIFIMFISLHHHHHHLKRKSLLGLQKLILNKIFLSYRTTQRPSIFIHFNSTLHHHKPLHVDFVHLLHSIEGQREYP